ncbi:hypothetical protein Xen7305DRAFT_00013490 [Xenococcus sp. PCC 7305]|uniref:hypothetical protein n=1 Tax=Xenococcus sp. PCC 7305 TaxID=102125 RepID=UPI0002ACF1A3|nr:hypothetical protein [Xenococcus sp. PCC 7305]ELS01644.1 hypothetical protein Xen7305DRAFT_00013490 [Xenococcus sp. PCC 7305]
MKNGKKLTSKTSIATAMLIMGLLGVVTPAEAGKRTSDRDRSSRTHQTNRRNDRSHHRDRYKSNSHNRDRQHHKRRSYILYF